MSPLVWDLAHIGNQEELWLLRDVGGREPILPETVDQLYDAFQHPRADRPSLPLLDPPRPARYVGEVREQGDRPAGADAAARPPAHRGRFRVRHDRPARAAARRDHAGHPSAAAGRPGAGRAPAAAPARRRPAPARGPGPGRAVHHGHLGRIRGRWTTSGPRTRSRSTAFWLDTVPGQQRRLPGFHRRRRVRPTGAGGSGRLGAPCSEAGLAAPLFWRRDGGDWLRRRFGRLEAVPAGRAGRCTSAGTRPTPTRAGPAGGCRPKRNGRRRPGTTRQSGRARQYPWGDDDPRPSGPTSASEHLQPGRGRRLPGGRVAAGHPAADRRRLGVDVQRLHSATPASPPGRTGSTRRCSSAPTTRCCAVARSAADRAACRGTFRNWDYPIRRQIFAGFRCARDAAPGEG